MLGFRRPTVLVIGAALAVGLAACGGPDESALDVVPRSTPALTAPDDTSLPDVTTSATTTSTTATTTTSRTATSTGGTGATATGTATTGGTGATGTTTTTTTTSGAASGGFSDFCSQNPGACPGN